MVLKFHVTVRCVYKRLWCLSIGSMAELVERVWIYNSNTRVQILKDVSFVSSLQYLLSYFGPLSYCMQKGSLKQ